VPADCAAVDVDRNFDDVMLPGTGAEELRARLRLAVGRRRGTSEPGTNSWSAPSVESATEQRRHRNRNGSSLIRR